MKSQHLPDAPRTLILFTAISGACLFAIIFIVWWQVLALASFAFWPSSWLGQRVLPFLTHPATLLVSLYLFGAFAWHRNSMHLAMRFLFASLAVVVAPLVLLLLGHLYS